MKQKKKVYCIDCLYLCYNDLMRESDVCGHESNITEVDTALDIDIRYKKSIYKKNKANMCRDYADKRRPIPR